MAIVKMKEFSLYFLKQNKAKVLEKLQAFGGLEFRNFQKYIEVDEKDKINSLKLSEYFRYLELDEKDALSEQNLNKIKYCLEVLRPYVPKESLIKSLTDDKLEVQYGELKKLVASSNWEQVYNELKEINSQISSLDSEYLKCISDIELNQCWDKLEGKIKDYTNLNYVTCIFGSISNQFKNEITDKFSKDFELSNVQILNTTQQDTFFVIIVHNNIKQQAFEFLKSKGFNFQVFSYEEKVSDYLKNLENRKQEILNQKEELKNKIEKFKTKYTELQYAFEFYNSTTVQSSVSQNFLESDSFLICRGYIEEENTVILENYLLEAVGNKFYVEFKDVKLDDSSDVPVKLSNGPMIAPFEGVVEMYSNPSYSEVDPTPAISLFFVIFFGMMLADVGYGLIVALGAAFLYAKSKTVQKKNTYRLFIFVGISTIVWGVLYGAYFGDFLERYLNIKPPVFLNVNTQVMTIFGIAVAFGFIHLTLALIMKGIVYFKNGRKLEVLFDVLPWLLIIFGVIVMALQGVVPVFSIKLGAGMLIAGILILLFTQGREADNLVGKIAGGVYGVYGITGYIGDVISYSRLLALGLASGFIANAFNIMGQLIPFPFNIVITPLMLIPLHLFNVAINALGTFVHSARLQYLEFFGKFYSGGGRKFTPFKYTDKYIRIKK